MISCDGVRRVSRLCLKSVGMVEMRLRMDIVVGGVCCVVSLWDVVWEISNFPRIGKGTSRC